MTSRKYTALFVISVIFVLLLNLMTGYASNKAQEYISYGSVSISKNILENADRILKNIDYGDYQSEIIKMQKEYDDLILYRNALAVMNNQTQPFFIGENISKQMAAEIVGESMMSNNQAAVRQEVLSYCTERLNYAADYREYVLKIRKNAENMSGVSIFGEKAQKNIIKAESKFYGLENIRISAESDAGIGILFSDTLTDIFGVMFSLVCAVFFAMRCRKADFTDKGRTAVFALILAFGIIAMYSSNLLMTDFTGDMSRAIQSVSEYRSCPYIISEGTFIALRIIFKAAACIIIYFLCTALILSENKIRYAVFAAFVIISEILLVSFGSEIHFGTLFNAENIMGRYGSVFIFGEAANPLAMLFVLALALLILSAFSAERNVKDMLIVSKELAEKKYYNEINEKYNETRQIRHDIKNHLTAVAMLIDDGNISDARKYLDEISAEMDNVKPPVKTGSSVLDALLFNKNELMRSMGIALDIEFASDFEKSGISEYDICGIFGNILDNACEACKSLPDEDKKIRLSVKRQMDMLCIFCENRYADINSDLSTKKADKRLHGLGLKRVKSIAEKYGGAVEITAENNIFSLSVILNIAASA